LEQRKRNRAARVAAKLAPSDYLILSDFIISPVGLWKDGVGVSLGHSGGFPSVMIPRGWLLESAGLDGLDPQVDVDGLVLAENDGLLLRSVQEDEGLLDTVCAHDGLVTIGASEDQEGFTFASVHDGFWVSQEGRCKVSDQLGLVGVSSQVSGRLSE